MLEVRFIGKFELKSGGKPVTISSRVAQSLFAYLILTAGTLHRREKLAGMFWPDEAEEKARAYLRTELWRIRKVLPNTSKVEYLLTDDLTIGFNQSSGYWLDVAALTKVSGNEASDDLITGLSFYQGELLPGFYDEWITHEREHLQAIYEQKMARLLELLIGEKRWQDILEWAERWISLGQRPEAAYRYLMIGYDALGDRAKVASTYERCVQALRELDLEPSEQTRALAFKRTSTLNIPIPLTSFIGREKELKEVIDLFSKSRLVTLTGSGGVGKTRLSIQIVAELLEHFPDGIWFLDLAPLSDPALVPNTLAQVLDLHPMGGSDLSITDLIIGYLNSRRVLIIFDNCEHLIGSCAQLVHSLLTTCEHLSVLATSREALRVSGEIPYRVPSLKTPGLDIESAIDALEKIESVRLFRERAAVISPGFTISPQNALVIAKICQRLDGIPLAIELAAARTNILSVQQILTRLDDRFNLLKGGLRTDLPRHQTLRGAIEWSCDLLSEKERLLFTRLAVFIGGWTLEAAEEVCSGGDIKATDILDLLSQLVNKSLVVVAMAESGRRYRRLETIRQFARDELGRSGEEETIRALHLDYFVRLAEKAFLDYRGERAMEWVQKLEAEYENMRAALAWSLQSNTTAGQQLAGALGWFWGRSDRSSEGYGWMQKMLAVSSGNQSLVRARLLVSAGWGAAWLSDNDQAKAYAEEALALYRQAGDKAGIIQSQTILVSRALSRAELDEAAVLVEQSIALWRETGAKDNMADALDALGLIAQSQGKFDQAYMYYRESLLLHKEDEDQMGVGFTLFIMGDLERAQGNDVQAMKLYEEALQVNKAISRKPMVGNILTTMGSTAICIGDYERGRMLLEETIDLWQKMGDQASVAYSLHYLAWGACLQGKYARARSLYSEALQLLHHRGTETTIAECLIGVGQLMGAQGKPEAFVRLLGMAVAEAPNIDKMLHPLFRTETEKFTELARAALGEEVYIAAWEAGRQTSREEGIAYALRELQ